MEKNIFQDKVQPTLLLRATALVSVCEGCGGTVFENMVSPMESLLIIRTIELTLMVAVLRYMKGGFEYLGISNSATAKRTLYKGVKTGLVWSLVCAIASLAVGALFFCFTGKNPTLFLDTPLPEKSTDLALFLFTGCIISPIAEEFFFRGVLYTYFSKYGVWIALVATTSIFTLCHMGGASTVPVVPFTGGIIFALSYQHSKSLAAPIIIHTSGNIAIFTISLIY